MSNYLADGRNIWQMITFFILMIFFLFLPVGHVGMIFVQTCNNNNLLHADYSAKCEHI